MEKCEWCGKEFKNVIQHQKYCKMKPIEDEVILDSKDEDILDSKDEDILDSRFDGLDDDQLIWLTKFEKGFRFNGQIKSSDMDNLEYIYKLKINKNLPGTRDCKWCRINMALAITNYFK